MWMQVIMISGARIQLLMGVETMVVMVNQSLIGSGRGGRINFIQDGLLAGKEASAQEGFNAGFRESVVAGYNWGLVRGITSTLTFLPDELKAKLVERSDKSDELQALYEATRSVPSNEALRYFHDDVMSRNSLDGGPDSSGDLIQPNVVGDFSYCGKLESFKKNLKSVVSESPASGITAILESKIAG